MVAPVAPLRHAVARRWRRRTTVDRRWWWRRRTAIITVVPARWAWPTIVVIPTRRWRATIAIIPARRRRWWAVARRTAGLIAAVRVAIGLHLDDAGPLCGSRRDLGHRHCRLRCHRRQSDEAQLGTQKDFSKQSDHVTSSQKTCPPSADIGSALPRIGNRSSHGFISSRFSACRPENDAWHHHPRTCSILRDIMAFPRLSGPVFRASSIPFEIFDTKTSKSRLTVRVGPFKRLFVAQMAELVDAPASGAGTRKGVEVRVLFWAPNSRFRPSRTVQKQSKKPGFPGFFVVWRPMTFRCIQKVFWRLRWYLAQNANRARPGINRRWRRAHIRRSRLAARAGSGVTPRRCWTKEETTATGRSGDDFEQRTALVDRMRKKA